MIADCELLIVWYLEEKFNIISKARFYSFWSVEMDWSLSGGVPCISLISLGILYQDKYYVSDDCLSK